MRFPLSLVCLVAALGCGSDRGDDRGTGLDAGAVRDSGSDDRDGSTSTVDASGSDAASVRDGSTDDAGTGQCANPDGDGDGHDRVFCGGGDCRDDDATIHPDAADSVGDDVDQNCDGVDGVDGDGDGVPSTTSGGQDCDDADPLRRPDFPAGWAVERQPVTTSLWDAAAGPDGVQHVLGRVPDANDQRIYLTNETGPWTMIMLLSEVRNGDARIATDSAGNVYGVFQSRLDNGTLGRNETSSTLVHQVRPPMTASFEGAGFPRPTGEPSFGHLPRIDVGDDDRRGFTFGIGFLRTDFTTVGVYRPRIITEDGEGTLNSVTGTTQAYTNPEIAMGPDGPFLAQTINGTMRAGTLAVAGATARGVDIGPSGEAHVLYDISDGSDRTLRHAVNTVDGWDTEEVARFSGSTAAVYGEMVVDGSGRVHVCYASERRAYYASRASVGVFEVHQLTADGGRCQLTVTRTTPTVISVYSNEQGYVLRFWPDDAADQGC